MNDQMNESEGVARIKIRFSGLRHNGISSPELIACGIILSVVAATWGVLDVLHRSVYVGLLFIAAAVYLFTVTMIDWRRRHVYTSKRHLHLQLSEDEATRLADTVRRVGAKDGREATRRALARYEEFSTLEAEGYRIIVRDPAGTDREVFISAS